MKQTSLVSHTSEDRSFIEAKINTEMKIESRRDLFYQCDMYSDDFVYALKLILFILLTNELKSS